MRINGDVAFLKGVMKHMFEEEQRRPGEVLDRPFIERHTSGFREFHAALKQVSWDDIVEQSGLSREQIGQAAEIAIQAKSVICCWAMGLTQHKNAVDNIQEIVNFLMLRGNLGRPGAGACPVRGHSNVQGDRTMGIFEKMPDEFLNRLGDEFAFSPPREYGLDTVETIRAMHAGLHRRVCLDGRQLSFGDSRHRFHRGRAAQLPPHGADLDQAQSQPSDHRAAGADPARARPLGERYPGGRASIRHH